MPRVRKRSLSKGQKPIISLFAKMDKPGESSKAKHETPNHGVPFNNKPPDDAGDRSALLTPGGRRSRPGG
ncbi:hypothetical protein V8D89_009735 [Ganoderma adspersum]